MQHFAAFHVGFHCLQKYSLLNNMHNPKIDYFSLFPVQTYVLAKRDIILSTQNICFGRAPKTHVLMGIFSNSYTFIV